MPMRILGRGRDAYILAGYLHKRGRWTPHWSERYFVLTSTHIHYFKKDRNQLFGEERGTIPIDRCVVRARHGKDKEFEIIAFVEETAPTPSSAATTPTVPKKKNSTEPKKRSKNNLPAQPPQLNSAASSPHSTSTQPSTFGDADDEEENSQNEKRKQPRPWILKAKSEEECVLWIKAIHDAQSQVTPAMIAAAQKPMRPPPRLAQRSNKNLFNAGAMSGTALSSTIAASTTSTSTSSPRAPDSARSTTSANGVAIPVAQPVNPHLASSISGGGTGSVSSIAVSASTLSQASMSPTLASNTIPTKSSSYKSKNEDRLYSVDEDPILLVTLEQDRSHEIVLGRMVIWGTPLSLGPCSAGSQLVACMHDGRLVRIPTEQFTSPGGSRDFQVDDPYSDTHVRVKWSASRSMTRLPPQPDMPTFLQSIGFPLLFLVMCLYMALSAIITQLYQDFPLLDVRKLWLTQTGYVIFFGMCLAVEMIRLNLSKFTPPPSSRTITVTFAARTHPYPNDANISLGQGAIYAAAMRNGGVIGNTVIGELGRNLVQDVSQTPLRIHRRADDDESSDDGDNDLDETKLTRNTSDETVDNNNETRIGSQAGGIRDIPTVGPVDAVQLKRAVSRITMPSPPTAPPEDEDEDGATDVEADDDEDDGVDEQGVRKPAVHTAEWGGWTDADYTVTQVRGKDYMVDQKKIPSDRPIFRSAHLDVFCTPEKLYHMSARPNSYANQRYKAVLKEREHLRALGLPIVSNPEADTLSPLIVINFMVPLGDRNCNLLLYFTRKIHSKRSKGSDFNRIVQGSHPHAHTYKPVPINTNLSSNEEAKESPRSATTEDDTSEPHHRSDSISATHRSPHSTSRQSSADMDGALAAARAASLAQVEEDTSFDEQRLAAFDRLLMNFMRGSDEFRSARMKVIPRVADGGWIVKKVVGGRPAILGQKITQYYYKNEELNYIEIAVDLGSSKMAGKILQVVNGQASKLVVDITFLLQGETEDELPESLIGGFSLIHLKIDKFKPLSELGI